MLYERIQALTSKLVSDVIRAVVTSVSSVGSTRAPAKQGRVYPVDGDVIPEITVKGDTFYLRAGGRTWHSKRRRDLVRRARQRGITLRA